MAKKFEVEKDFHNARFDRWFKHKVLDIPPRFNWENNKKKSSQS